jgi:site-specific recombinase XerC
MIVVLGRAGLRVQEALALTEHDLDPRRGSLLVRRGKGGRRREVGMDEWGWEEPDPWLTARADDVGQRRPAVLSLSLGERERARRCRFANTEADVCPPTAHTAPVVQRGRQPCRCRRARSRTSAGVRGAWPISG